MNYINNYIPVTPTFDTDKMLQNVASLFRTGLWTKISEVTDTKDFLNNF